MLWHSIFAENQRPVRQGCTQLLLHETQCNKAPEKGRRRAKWIRSAITFAILRNAMMQPDLENAAWTSSIAILPFLIEIQWAKNVPNARYSRMRRTHVYRIRNSLFTFCVTNPLKQRVNMPWHLIAFSKLTESHRATTATAKSLARENVSWLLSALKFDRSM